MCVCNNFAALRLGPMLFKHSCYRTERVLFSLAVLRMLWQLFVLFSIIKYVSTGTKSTTSTKKRRSYSRKQKSGTFFMVPGVLLTPVWSWSLVGRGRPRLEGVVETDKFSVRQRELRGHVRSHALWMKPAASECIDLSPCKLRRR